jgi:hypothetical protein
MENSILKDKLHKVVDSADPELLELLYSTASEYKDSVSDLNSSQLAELKRRLDHFESGEMKFSSSNEVMTRIRMK